MNFQINRLSVWTEHRVLSPEQQSLPSWPKLDFVPAMQRRRLSPFAKMALYVANECTSSFEQNLPIVFSSRHGDLHNTSKLIANIAERQEPSPTAFALSVHNAIPGLYSILTGNNHAINAVSAGKDTFFMALVDAYARLKSGQEQRILLIHVDQALPQVYQEFNDEQQISHAIAMVIELPETKNKGVSLSYVGYDKQIKNTHKSNDAKATLEKPLALNFYEWYKSQEPCIELFGAQKKYSLIRND